jgi:hypothetical protein
MRISARIMHQQADARVVAERPELDVLGRRALDSRLSREHATPRRSEFVTACIRKNTGSPGEIWCAAP